MTEVEGFARRIFFLRTSFGKSQQEVGEALGLTKGSISSFEKEKSMPSPVNLIKLASLFNVSIDYLLTGQANWSETEKGGDKKASNHPVVYDTQNSIRPRKSHTSTSYNSAENGQMTAVEKTSIENQLSFKDVLANSEITQVTITRHIVKEGSYEEEGGVLKKSAPLPEFDQSQIDKRFLTELDRLLRISAFPTYTAWARAVDVGPSYVSAIEKGKYHFNIELLYKTLSHFPAFDFIYVLFGSALSSRPEPAEFPKRERGPRSRVDN